MALNRAEKAKQFALEQGKQHGLDTSAELTAYNEQLKETKAQLELAPKPPPRFRRVPNEAAICAAMELPPGRERNTELALLFSELDRFNARTLHDRISEQKDPEDEIAREFARIVAARPLLLGILDGTRRIKLDPNQPRSTVRGGSAGPSSSTEAPHATTPTEPPSQQVQRKADGAPASSPELVAQRGFTGASEPLPFGAQIQRSFGRHDVSDVRAYQGSAAKESADQLGAEAYTTGRQIAFGRAPDLRTASHEAAHTVQQRLGVQLMGGIDGGAGDPYEQHADQVAEAVVAGRSAEALLDRMPSGTSASAGVQRSPKTGAAIAHDETAHDEPQAESVPARGSYLVEQLGGSYRFVFNTSDRNRWHEPVLTGLRYYMHQVFPGVGDPVIREVFGELRIRLEGNGSSPMPLDHRYELTVDPKIHKSALAWMSTHHPELAPRAPKLGGGSLRSVDAGGPAKTDASEHHARTSAHDGPAHAQSMAADAAHSHARPGATHAHEGIQDGSLHGDPDSEAHGWQRWAPKGELKLYPAQPTYIAGSTISTELAWDLSVHPDAGQVLLPQHCTYAWTVHRGGKLVSSDGRSVLGDDRRAELRVGKEHGTYAIEVTATSPHFRAARQRFSARTVVNVISEQAFDRAAFDAAQVAGPDAAFTRDAQGALHLRPGQTARTPQDEIGKLDLSRGGIDALAAKGQIGREDHDVAAGELANQRAELVRIQAQVAGGMPYVVRGTFVSREDSSTTPMQLMMHVLRRAESGDEARYELVLHDTTFGEPSSHPGGAPGRVDPAAPRAAYGIMEAEALERMAHHFHAHNVYPRGTVHLAVQRLASGEVWEKTLDTDNGRKTAKRILGGAALVGGAALMIVPGGNVVSAGLLVLTSGAGIASVAADLEDRLAQGQVRLDRRLAMDVLQVAAIALPFGTLTRTFAAARPVAKTGFALCMVGLDAAQGFVIAADAKQKLSVIEASTAVELASATTDEQRKAIHAERDRRVAEVLGGAVVNGGFLLVSLGAGLKNIAAASRKGTSTTPHEARGDVAQEARKPTEQSLSSTTVKSDEQATELADVETEPTRDATPEAHEVQDEDPYRVASARGREELLWPSAQETGTDDLSLLLPSDLHGVPIIRLVELHGTEVQVRYRRGTLRVEVGPRATARHIGYHASTIRRLRHYEGAIGLTRRLVDRVRTKLRSTPGYGTAGFEARAEVAKLREIERELISLRSRLEAGTHVPEGGRTLEISTVDAEIERVQDQLEEEAARIDSYEPGRGFVAARDMPVYPLAASPDVVHADVLPERDGIFMVEFSARAKDGSKIVLGQGSAKHSSSGRPARPAEFVLYNDFYYRGTEYKVKLYEETIDPGGEHVPLPAGEVVPLTRYAIDRFVALHRRRFGQSPEALGGTLAWENKRNFQIEFRELVLQGMDEHEALTTAAQKISYGRHRVEAGYSKLEVQTEPSEHWKPLDLDDGKRPVDVPHHISIIGRKP